MTGKKAAPKRPLTEAQKKERNQKRRDRAARKAAEAVAPVLTPNPWLLGAIVTVLPVKGNHDSHKQGTIESVDPSDDTQVDVHTVVVRLRDGRVVSFLSNQLVLA